MNDITEEEAQQYDRQIRLWGADAQRRLKKATVIVIGVNSVSCEVIKNLVLAGINTLALCDINNVSNEDINNNYLISRSARNKNRAEAVMLMTKNLNPRVNVETYDYMPIEIYNDGGRTLSIQNYDIVICCESSLGNFKDGSLWVHLNDSCRKHNKLFFAMDTFGWHGITFLDLGTHHYVKDEEVSQKDVNKASTSESKLIEQVKDFCTFKDVMSIDWSKNEFKSRLKRMPNVQFLLLAVQKFVSEKGHYPTEAEHDSLIDTWYDFADANGLPRASVTNDSFKECIGPGQLPVNAVLGGLVTQEIIKAISCKNEPFGNFVLFNGITCAGDATFIKL